MDLTDEYIEEHLAIAAKYNKPLVLEEFGYPRDGVQYSKSSPVTARDKYYAHVLQHLVKAASEDGLLAGINFWAWGGLAGQSETNLYWRPGDDYCGDPAQEPQGLYSVYASDESTVNILRDAAYATLRSVQAK
jgi:mannan endo-1,4-beta-mannosidase